MSRYIDADTFDDTVLTLNAQGWGITRGEYKLMDSVLFEMPTADVVERKRGEWIQHVNEPSLWSCSICETVIYSEHEEDRLKFHKWCGCCGADMRGNDD